MITVIPILATDYGFGMELVEGTAFDRADYIPVKAKPGYSEKFIKAKL